MQQHQDLNLPAPPTYYQNPLQQGDISSQSQLAGNLINGNLPSWLQSTINPNNSQNALTAAQGILQPQFRDTLQQIDNQAAANNQLDSSTFTDALARSQSDLNSQYQSIVSQQAINDANQANQNKLSLFGSGLGTLQSAIGNEQQDTGAQNSFNLQNYGNQVAQAIQQNQNANNANPLTQVESLLSPEANSYYQSQGINQVPGFSVPQIISMGSTVAGMGSGGGGIGNVFGNGLNTSSSASGVGSNYGQFYNGQYSPAQNGIGVNPQTGQYIWNPYAHIT